MPPRRSPSSTAKYGNHRTEYGGRSYHSKLEALYAAKLDLLKEAGEVAQWEPQVRISLKGESGQQVAYYVADFRVRYVDGRQELVETKGYWTSEAKLKLRWLKADYPDTPVRIIKKGDL